MIPQPDGDAIRPTSTMATCHPTIRFRHQPTSARAATAIGGRVQALGPKCEVGARAEVSGQSTGPAARW
jgi:hypothetical protein